MADLGEKHDISPEQALSVGLERNVARLSVVAAQSVKKTILVQEELVDPCEYLDCVESLDTTDVENKIERIWSNEFGLP